MTTTSPPGACLGPPLRGPEEIGDELEELPDVLEPNPTYVMGPRWDLLAWNRSARTLFADWGRRPARERNMLWYYLCEPSARELFVDWEAEAADQLAHFREYFARHPGDPAYSSLLEEIFAVTPRARAWWGGHKTEPNRSGRKRVRLPDGTVVMLRQLVLQAADSPGVQVVTYFADADTPDADTPDADSPDADSTDSDVGLDG